MVQKNMLESTNIKNSAFFERGSHLAQAGLNVTM